MRSGIRIAKKCHPYFERMDKAEYAPEKSDILGALGCTKNADLLVKYMDQILNTTADPAIILESVAKNSFGSVHSSTRIGKALHTFKKLVLRVIFRFKENFQSTYIKCASLGLSHPFERFRRPDRVALVMGGRALGPTKEQQSV